MCKNISFYQEVKERTSDRSRNSRPRKRGYIETLCISLIETRKKLAHPAGSRRYFRLACKGNRTRPRSGKEEHAREKRRLPLIDLRDRPCRCKAKVRKFPAISPNMKSGGQQETWGSASVPRIRPRGVDFKTGDKRSTTTGVPFHVGSS